MMSRLIRRLREFGPFTGDLALSAVACFALMRGFRLLAIEEIRPDTGDSFAPRARLASNWGVSAQHSFFWPSSRVKLRQLL